MFEFNLTYPKLDHFGFITVAANMKEKHDRSTPSNYHWKILKCRMIIFSTSSILAYPDKSDEKQIYIVFNQHGRDYDTLMLLFSKFSLQQVGGINKVTNEIYISCFRYTMTARLAPTWNVLGHNYLINNRDFLTTSEPQNAIQFFLNDYGDFINMKMIPVKIHFIKHDKPFLPEEYVRVLPSLNKAIIKESFESLPTGGEFKSYKDLRRHWKNIHGYRLPDMDRESTYYALQFWRGQPLTYPDICLTRTFPIITPLPKSIGVTLASAFVETLQNKMPYNLKKSPPKLVQCEKNSCTENDLQKTQAVSLCTPSQSQRVQRLKTHSSKENNYEAVTMK